MIDVIVDGFLKRRPATGGGGLGGLGITPLPTRLSEMVQRLKEAVRATLLLGEEREIPLDVSVQLLIYLPAGNAIGAVAFAAVGADDRFSVTLPVDEGQLDDGFTFVLRLRGVVPEGFSGAGGTGGELTPADIPDGTPGATPGAQLVAVIQGRLRNLEVAVSTADLELFSVTVAPPPDENGRAFRDIGNALVEFLAEDGAQVGVGVLRGNENTRTANVFLVPGARTEDMWFRVRRGTDVQFDEPSSFTTLGRGVLTPPEIGFSERIAMMRIEENIGVGTLSNEIAEAAVVTDTPLVYKDLDIDLTSAERLRVRCKVGLGFELFGAVIMIQRLGEFEGQYAFGIDQDNTDPFDFDDLASVVTVTGVSSSFDWLPGTDLDDLNGQDYVEAVVAAFISDQVVARVQARIGDRVVERAEEAVEPIRDNLAAFPDTADQVAASVFVQLNSLEVTVDEIQLVARGGVWHPVLELLGAEVECAVTQTAMMTRRRAVVPVARMVQKRLGKQELRPWAEAYSRHKADLARLLKANPELATAVARAIVDGAPVAAGLAHVLDPDLRRRVLQIARSITEKSEGELAFIAALGVRLIESHDTRTPLFRRAEQLAKELPAGPTSH